MERQYLLLSPVGNSQHFEVNIFLIVQFITWFRIVFLKSPFDLEGKH